MPAKYFRLSYQDRIRIEKYLCDGKKSYHISIKLGVNRSTISREISRNKDSQGNYRAIYSQKKTKSRARCRKLGKRRLLLKDTLHNFEYILGAEEGYFKSDKIQFICRKWGVKIEDIIYFTDTQRDVYQLENYMSKNQIYGCAWGWHGYERLAKVLPETNILKNFTDIHKIDF